VPGKNVRALLGKPLIVWSIEQAMATPEIDHVVVSTDSDEIADVARAAGAEVPFMRPVELARAETGKFQVWQHALTACEAHYGTAFECFVDLDCTSPLRDIADVSGAIARFRARRASGVDIVFSVCEARKNPYFNLLEMDDRGALVVSKPMGDFVVARQAAPRVFEHIGVVYVLDPDFLRRADYLLDGYAEGYEVDADKRYDIDSELDFRIVEMLMREKLEATA
jgi:CMP-N-acetylneuraminic acid synthetase